MANSIDRVRRLQGNVRRSRLEDRQNGDDRIGGSIDQEADEGAPDLGPWLLLRRSDDAVIGTISCARTGDPVEVSVGYDIASSCWGEGYATEALGAVVEHLLSQPDVGRVCAEAKIDHAASRRVMEKSGMRWQRDEVAEHEGREVKLAHYAIDRPAPV